MTDHFVMCRHCGVGTNVRCDHAGNDVAAEDHAAVVAENERLRAALRAELAVSRKANESNGLAYEHVVELYEVEKARADRLEAVLREVVAHHRDQADAWRDEGQDDENADYHAERAAAAAKCLEER